MKKFFKGFIYAFSGIKVAVGETNMKFHIAVAVLVVMAGVLFGISPVEWVACILSIALILSLETINTAIEHLCNHVSPHIHPEIKAVKDAAAAAVLLASIGVAVVGLIVFVPYVIDFIGL